MHSLPTTHHGPSSLQSPVSSLQSPASSLLIHNKFLCVQQCPEHVAQAADGIGGFGYVLAGDVQFARVWLTADGAQVGVAHQLRCIERDRRGGRDFGGGLRRFGVVRHSGGSVISR